MTPASVLPRQFVIRTGKRLLRALSAFQAKHSRIPTTPFLAPEVFSWTGLLEASSEEIRQEVLQLMPDLALIPSFHQVSPDQARISTGENWKTFVLYVFGQPIPANVQRCPFTSALLASLPGLQNAWFSILAPGYHIPPHRGPTRALVRCHLGLIVPENAERCWIRVDDQRRHWRQNECLLFDDTYEHEVHNDTPEHRVVLFLDFNRPMDRIGTWLNAALIGLLKMSAYVKDPLKNLERMARGANG